MRNLTRCLIVMSLILWIMPTMFAEPSKDMMLEPPPRLTNFTTVDGQKVIYFTETGWTELSNLIYAERYFTAQAAAAAAARPLLAEIEEKNVIIDERRKGRALLKIGLGLGGVGAIGLSIYSFVNADIVGGVSGLGLALIQTIFLLR